MNQSQIEHLLKTVPPFLPRGGQSTHDILNPDFAFALWYSEHSVAKAAKYLEEIGVTSYRDKPYTRAAIHLAAKKSKYYEEERKAVAEKHQRLVRRIRSDAKKLSQ
jgi:hypothetical protein